MLNHWFFICRCQEVERNDVRFSALLDDLVNNPHIAIISEEKRLKQEQISASAGSSIRNASALQWPGLVTVSGRNATAYVPSVNDDSVLDIEGTAVDGVSIFQLLQENEQVST